MFRTLYLLTLSLFLPIASANALPAVYDSTGNNGINTGIAQVNSGGSPRALNLFFDAGKTSFGYLLTLQADLGMELISFTAEPSLTLVDFGAGDGGFLNLTGGDTQNGNPGATRLGTLVVRGTAPGRELRLINRDPTGTGPVFVDDTFAFVPIQTPQTIAITIGSNSMPVPEPRAWVCFAMGLALVGWRVLHRTPTQLSP